MKLTAITSLILVDNYMGQSNKIPSEYMTYKDLFVKEARERIEKLIKNHEELKKDFKDKKILDSNQIEAHAIKGEAAAMKMDSMAYLAHVLEDIFDYAKNDFLLITDEIMPILSESLSELRESLKQIESSSEEVDLSDIIDKLKNISGVNTEGTGPSKRDADGKPILKKPAR